MGEILIPEAQPRTIVQLVSSLATNTASLSAIGGTSAVAFGVIGFLKGYRNAQDAQARDALSADRLVSIAASSTSSLLTLQFQIKAAV
jgi:hypothetical protein